MKKLTIGHALLSGTRGQPKQQRRGNKRTKQAIASPPIRGISAVDPLRLPQGHAQAAGAQPDRTMRRAQEFALCGVSPREVDFWLQQGLLRRIRLAGSTQAVDFRESVVLALIAEGSK